MTGVQTCALPISCTVRETHTLFDMANLNDRAGELHDRLESHRLSTDRFRAIKGNAGAYHVMRGLRQGDEACTVEE